MRSVLPLQSHQPKNQQLITPSPPGLRKTNDQQNDTFFILVLPRFTPLPDIHFPSHLIAPYPPAPDTYLDLLPLLSPLPPVNPILTSVYEEHDILPYLDSIDVDDTFFHDVPSQLNNAYNLPNIPPSDRVSSSEPRTKLNTTEHLQKCRGFRNIDRIVKNLIHLTNDTILLRDTGNDPILSRGETATLPKRSMNSGANPRPSRVSDVFHYGIGYGHSRAIGSIHHVLFLVDRKTHITYVFGLKNLEHDIILLQMKKIIRTIGKYPQEMIADRDFRLIGQAIDNFLEQHSQVSGAPSGRQSQNGLRECNWKYIYNIARNYMADKLLPSEFWFFAINYAVQISNYLSVDVGQTDSHPDHPSTTATVLTVPVHHLTSLYSLQLAGSSDIVEIIECELLPHNPTAIIDSTNVFLTLPWIKHGAKTTLFLLDVMLTPK